MPYDVVYLEPIRKDAPLPPGLSHWPEPGEAVLSPALLSSVKSHGGLVQFGRFGGVIGADGLEAPAERFAYVRPSAEMLDRSKMFAISGFGPEASAGFVGESIHNFGSQKFYAAYTGLVLLPVALLVVIAARVGAAARDRRTALLGALGAGRRGRLAFTLGEAAPPVAWGAALAASIASIPLLCDSSFPLVEFVLSKNDARQAWPELLLCLAGVPIVVLFVAVVLQPGFRWTAGTRPASLPTRRAWTVWVFPFALLATVRGTELAPLEFRIAVYATGCVIVLAALPAVIGVAVGRLGPFMASAGRRMGAPGLLVSGRRLGVGSRSVARLVASMVIAIGLAAQTQLWTGVFGEFTQSAIETQKRVGTTVLRVTPYAGADRVRIFESGLPPGDLLLAVGQTADRVEIVGECAALREIGLPCTDTAARISAASGDARLREILNRTGVAQGAKAYARRGSVAYIGGSKDGSPTLLIVGRGRKQMSVSEIQEVAGRSLAMKASVRPLGDLSDTGKLKTATDWVRLMSLVGVGVIGLVAGTSAMAEFLRFGRELAPLSVLTGSRRIFRSVALWSLLMPAVLAAAFGVSVSWWLATPLASTSVTTPASMAPIALGALACAVGLASWGACAAVRTAEMWKPSSD
ncbi:hypothetical protein AB9Q10_40220 [Streptomyces krungchingensis]|uniref:hypothetical protein n=1 Tax=Streptomyces krungchingensis TaxID=1565034 RepID=UPI003CF2DC49